LYAVTSGIAPLYVNDARIEGYTDITVMGWCFVATKFDKAVSPLSMLYPACSKSE
jgi:hypothetical protein